MPNRDHFGQRNLASAPKPKTSAEILAAKSPLGLVACAQFTQDPDLIRLAGDYNAAFGQIDRQTDKVTRDNLTKDRAEIERRLLHIWEERADARNV